MSQVAKTYTQQILYTGTQAAYAAATKDNNALYFTSDTHKLYKGSVDFSKAVEVATTNFPASGAADNKLYVVNDASGNFVKAGFTTDGGTTWETVAIATITSITDQTATDNVVATAAAVKSYVDAAVGSDGVVADVTAGSANATLDVAYADSTVTHGAPVVPGVALIPSYDSTTRTITIPYTGGTNPAGTAVEAGTLTIALGKDMVVTAGVYNAATEEIWLYLTDEVPGTDEPSIKIPVSSLIDEIEVADTDTVDMTYTTATNTISADVKISAKANNAIQVLDATDEPDTAANRGLYVDLSSFATTAYVDTEVGTVQDNVDALYTALSGWATIS
jgi:hypothetical protein